MAESLCITVKTTAGEPPWSKGLIEQYNLVLVEMLDKVLGDSQCRPDLAVSWCINAKNSMVSMDFLPITYLSVKIQNYHQH